MSLCNLFLLLNPISSIELNEEKWKKANFYFTSGSQLLEKLLEVIDTLFR